MNKTNTEASAFFGDFSKLYAPSKEGATVIICAPFTTLSTVVKECKKLKALPGAQNFHPARAGAFTGEVSADMLVEAGAKVVIAGHSERRALFGETDEFINQKVIAAANAGLTVILCVGETIKERESGKTNAVLKKQLLNGLKGLASAEKLIIAYEPVWAIGSGLTATSEQIKDAHLCIKQLLAKQFGGCFIPVLYGGSVNEKNAAEIFAIQNVDGALVGGASLVPEKFAALVNAK
ncbi:triosephosphate isomerase [Holotrichia oblita]|nr:triosephosphate isomerase [Holotrichia oblita]